MKENPVLGYENFVANQTATTCACINGRPKIRTMLPESYK